jgi:hypothetical protein
MINREAQDNDGETAGLPRVGEGVAAPAAEVGVAEEQKR